MELAYMKNYLRLDSDLTADDALITALIKAAEQYITDKTGRVYAADDELFNVAVCFMVGHWYEKREVVPTRGQVVEIPHTATAIINHIAFMTAYPEG
jgi:uncharacterized phage protein (possible DNA packaging)